MRQLSEDVLTELYESMLEESREKCSCCESISAADLLREYDAVAYRTGKVDFEDSLSREGFICEDCEETFIEQDGWPDVCEDCEEARAEVLERPLSSISELRDDHLVDSVKYGRALARISAGERKNGAVYNLRFWDDGSGPLWLYRESLGIVGIVRCSGGFEDAYTCVQDEIQDGTTFDQMKSDCDWFDWNAAEESGELPEGYHWRGSGEPSNPAIAGPIACEDLNGSDLRLLTDADLTEFGLEIRVSE